MRRPKRSPSSATFAVQSLDARAQWYASARVDDALGELVGAPDHDARRNVLRRWIEESYLAGGDREASLETSVETAQATIRRLRETLLEHRIPAPGEARPTNGDRRDREPDRWANDEETTRPETPTAKGR